MDRQQVADTLAKPYARQLLDSADPARLAYRGLDGDPRAIPIGFWTEGDRILMATVPKAAKVAALREHPKVALTIDTNTFPPKALLIRGTVTLETVDGVPEGYLAGGRRFMSAEQYADWEAAVKGLYDEMVVITVTPTWATLLDFETTIPQAVADLVQEKTGAH